MRCPSCVRQSCRNLRGSCGILRYAYGTADQTEVRLYLSENHVKERKTMHHIQHPHPTHSGVDMTEGNITGHLIRFALPLLAGNIFQQLYNMVDTWVVGNFVSNEAFSAVGTVGPIVNMLIGCFLGFSSGAGVVISQYYGARRTERVHDAVHTALVLTVILCAVFTALGIGFTPLMLRLMNTPAEVFPESSAYLTIYFGGISGLLIYNMGSGILRAVGDSRRPFYFLVVSAVLNTARYRENENYIW